MPKFKCELLPGSYLTAADMLDVLSQQQLVAAALENTIVLAAEPAVAWLLDRCCIGRPIPDAPDSNSSSIAAHVATIAGVNVASEEWQRQYEQYLIRMHSRRRRKARRMPGYQAAAGVGMTMASMVLAHDAATGMMQQGEPGQLQPQGQTVPAELPGDALIATPGEVATAAAAAQPAAGHATSVQDHETLQQASGLLAPGPSSAATPPLAADTNQHITNHVVAAAGPVGAAADFECPAAMALDGADMLPVAIYGSGMDGSAWHMPLQLVQLSCQEAFFLASVLHCCTVFHAQHPAVHQARDSECLTAEQHQQEQQLQSCRQQAQFQQALLLPELWQWCCAHAPGGADIFVSRYAAYKHFRSKGWLPLPGLLYGADYVLYKLHPEHAHSDFVVTVMIERPGLAADTDMAVEPTVQEAGDHAVAQQTSGVSLSLQDGCDGLSGGSIELSSYSSTQMTWLDAHIMQRLARQVLKQFLLLYVVMPAGLQLQTAECMQHLEVREVLLQRWVPSQHREDGRE